MKDGSAIESPCLECRNMVTCSKMCYDRLEWAVFDANKDDEELLIYGNNLQVQGSALVKNMEDSHHDESVQALLSDFKKIYREVVIAPQVREQQRQEDYKKE